MLAASLVVQAIAALVLAVGSPAGLVDRNLIFVMCVLLGSARALQMPAQQAIVPALVAATQLPRAFALASTLLKFAVIGGPVLGGFLYAIGPAAAYGACFVLLVAATACIAAIRRIPPAVAKEPVSLATLFAGVAFIWRKKQVLGAISLDLFAVLLGGATALLPIYARDILSTGAWGLGFLRAAPAVGALLVGIALARWPLMRNVGRRMLACVAVYGAAIVVFGLSTNFALSMVALVVSGGADMVSVVIRQSLVQLDTPDDMRGPRQRGQQRVHRREQRAGRVSRGHGRRMDRAGRRRHHGRRRHAARRGALDADLPGARESRSTRHDALTARA